VADRAACAAAARDADRDERGRGFRTDRWGAKGGWSEAHDSREGLTTEEVERAEGDHAQVDGRAQEDLGAQEVWSEQDRRPQEDSAKEHRTKVRLALAIDREEDHASPSLARRRL
jgi:hypothetical protein